MEDAKGRTANNHPISRVQREGRGRATLGIAMGAAGSDAAIETADITLMSDDLAKLPWLVRHSRRTLAIIRQNIAFSLAVKAAFVALTFLGFASL